MIRRLSFVVVVLACAPAQAAEMLSSSYWEAAYLNSTFEEDVGSTTLEDETEGFRLGASIGLLPYLNFIGDYDQRRYADSRESFYSAGLAGHTLNPKYQFFGAVTYERTDFDDNQTTEDETQDGYGVQLGARAVLTNLEVHAAYKYLDLGKVGPDGELTGARYGAGLALDLSPWWSLVGDYSIRQHTVDFPGGSAEGEFQEWTVGFRRYLVTQTDRRKRTGGVLSSLFSESGEE